METLVIHPTDTSQWYALVNEAQVESSRFLPEDSESYLVFLLMRYVKDHELTSSVLAIDFLQAHLHNSAHRETLLQDVGDKSLLFSGLFPGLAERRQVNVDYYVAMGQSAYSSLSGMLNHTNAALFAQLSDDFTNIVEVMNTMRELPKR